MRRIYHFIFTLILFAGALGCQDERNLLGPSEKSSYVVSFDEARRVVSSIQIGDSMTTNDKLISNGRTNLKYHKIIREQLLVNAVTSEPELYIFNLNKGFIIVSGDKRLLPVLAFSDKGSFEVDTKNLGTKDWISSTKNVISVARQTNLEQSKHAQMSWQKFDSNPANPTTGPTPPPPGPQIIGDCGNTVGPLLTSTWDQGTGYNYSCPAATGGQCDKALTGCVATAIGQIARFWHSSRGAYFDYSIMEDAVANTCSPSTGDQETARLLRRSGDAVGMSWGASSSGAVTSNAPSAFSGLFGYSNGGSYSGNLDTYRLQGELYNGRPFLMRGEGTGSHCWVVDGCVHCGFSLGAGLPASTWEYYHMNWGWGGYCNGWYYYTSIRPTNNGTEIGYDFGANRAIVLGIHP